jgi:phosphoribosylformylglycinamidine (FGAM) synthase PurS component/archaellum component FlaC
MAKLKKGVFPGIARQGKQTAEKSAVTESIEILTGQRGSGNNRALLVSDLVNLDDMKRNALINSAKGGGTNDGGLPITTGGVENPHAPINLTATGGFTFIAVRWDSPTYRGHAYAEVWRSETNSFSEASLIATEVADIFSDSVSMGAEFYYWVRFVNVADVRGPTQGANGVFAKTVESAAAILSEIGGKIENSHLGGFLTSEIGKIPAFDFLLSDIIETEIPALKVNIDDFSVDIQSLRAGVNQSLEDIPIIQDAIQDLSDELPEIQQELTDLSNDTESARQIADNAKQRVESVEVGSDSLARQLIESALTSDINWQNNTTKLIEFESSLGDVTARIESAVFTKAEANEVIAAAAETIRVEIEATGLALSGDIESTYYTKATTDQAIAAASQQIKSQIEDVNGDSIGALLDSQYYTVVEADSAISLSAEQVKSEIESPTGNSLGALINNDYYSSVDTDTAIAAYGQQLKSEIENPNGNSIGATLKTDHYTRTEADNAISEATTQLGAEVTQEIDGAINTVNSNLTNNYYTSAATDQAIAISSQFLKSQIENPEGVSLGATLFNDYSTKVDTEEAVSRAIFELDSRFDPISEALIDNALAYDEANDRQLEITANILRTQEAITNEAQAQALSIENIETQFNESSARITQLTDALSSEISSSAQSIFQLDTKIEDNFSYLEVNYLTQVDTETAISEATTALKSQVEDGFNAVLNSTYYTQAETDNAIAQVSTQLQTDIDNLSSGLSLNYYTKVEADEATSQAITILKSDIEDPEGASIGADLYQNYLTSTQTGLAISQATEQLQSAIEDPNGSSLAADIYANFSTTTDTSSAISEATTALQSAIEDPNGNSLGATLFNEYETKADADESSAQSTQLLRAEFEPTAQALIEGALDNDLLYERRVVVEAEIINQQNVFADEQQALSESIFALNSAIGQSNASIEQLQTTFSTSAQSQAQNFIKLDSDLGDVKSDLVNNYFTSADVNEAIASADTALRSAIEDPNGNSVGADLQLNYYTQTATDSAVSEATTQLKSEIEDPNGNSIGADLHVNYYTRTETDSAVSQAATQLKSEIEDPEGNSVGADLHVNYLTTVEVNQAISIAQTQLSSEIEGVESTLQSDYLTSAEVGQAITVSNQLLKSEIEDEQGNSVGASLQVLGQTVATNEGVFSALWGVKTSVNGLQSSVGLVNDGVDPIFAVKGAKFSIITDQDSTNLTPVFAVSDGKTVINTAIIDEAFIKSLVTDDLLANRVIVGSRFTSPSINYNPSNGARSNNFSIDPNGNMLAKSATLESVTIKDSSGNIVMSSTGAIPSSKITGLGSFATKSSLSFNEVTGKPNFGNLAYLNSIAYDDVTGKPSLGPFAGLSKILSSNVTTYIANGAIGSAQIDQAYINQLFGNNASFFGTVYAENMQGDITDTAIKPFQHITMDANDETEITTLGIGSASFDRTLYIRKAEFTVTYGDSQSTNFYFRIYKGSTRIFNKLVDRTTGLIEDVLIDIPPSISGTLSLRMVTNRGVETNSSGGFSQTVYPGTPLLTQNVLVQIFKKASSLS